MDAGNTPNKPIRDMVSSETAASAHPFDGRILTTFRRRSPTRIGVLFCEKRKRRM
jgi:hypothetical protein